MEKMLLTPGEAAQLISVGRSKMYALLAAGVLPPVRVGKSLRVPVKALEKWVEAQQRTGEESA
jgi:excisionase family DNA binding protein